jgi:transcriptional regulator NrdR family protein
MVCTYCGGKTEVTNSRHQKRVNQVWRRRHCLNCGATFSTHELTAYDSVWRVQTDETSLTPFNRQKLFVALYMACEHRPTALDDATALTTTVISLLQKHANHGLLENTDIALTSYEVLKNFDKAAAVYYEARHKL